MAALKYSKQRESIKTFLAGRKDHPTAETIYTCLRETHPHISLGTVYRNLALLTELGEIKKISTGDGPDHFDGDTTSHHHFVCRKCQQVIDMEMDNIDGIIDTATKNFDGQIEGYVTNFYGVCEHCMKTHSRSLDRKNGTW